MTIRAIMKIHYNCNNNCEFCHCYDYRNKYKDKFNIISIIEKIKKAKDLGIQLVALSGGEPTIHKNIFEIVEEINCNGMKHGFISNGRMFAYGDFLEKFIKMGASYFYISLHSDKSDIHDLIVKSTGAWGQTTKGIENIANHQNKPELIINCIVLKNNVYRLKEISKFLIKLGVKKIKFSYPFVKGNMINNLNHLSDIEYSSNKISEALNFCNKNNVIGMYDGLPYCLIDEKFRMSLDNLRTNYFFYMTEYFENDFYRTRDGYKIYEKNKDCLKCSHNTICFGYPPGHKIKIRPLA